MITKTAVSVSPRREQGHTKEAFSPLHLLLPPAFHVGQNIATKGAMRSKKYHGHLAGKLNRAMSGSDVFTKGDTGVAMTRGLVPEIGILDDEIGHLGSGLKKRLESQGLNSSDITNEHRRQLGELLQGNFKSVADSAASDPRISKALLGTLSDQYGVDRGKAMRLLALARKNPEIMDDLEKLWKNNELTGKLFSGVGKQVENTEITGKSLPGIAHKAIRNAGNIAGNTAVALTDPITGMVNGTKIISSSKAMQKTPQTARLQNYANRKLVTERSDQLLRKGLAGEEIPFRQAKQLADNVLINPLTSNVKNLYYDFGRLGNKHLPREFRDLDKLKDMATSAKKMKGQINESDLKALYRKGLSGDLEGMSKQIDTGILSDPTAKIQAKKTPAPEPWRPTTRIH